MHYKKITKLAMCLLLAAGVSSSLMAATLIEKQQQELKAARAQWQQKNIPEGMQSGDLRAMSERDSGVENVSMQIKNVNFDVVENIGFYIEDLNVTLEPKTAGDPIVFDDVESFTINVHSGAVVLSSQVITDLFNQHILDYWPRPLNDLTITAQDDYLLVEGGLRLWSWLIPGIWLPAELGGKIVLNDDNKLVYEIDDVHVIGIPLFGLLSALFIDLDLLLSVDREGAELVDNNLELDHTKVFPPPALAGRLASATLNEDGLRLVFADNEAAEFSKPPVASDSYIWAQSGDPRLFGVVVNNGTVQVIADDTSKPLRFNLYDYRKQVAAGTIKMAKNGDIIATVPSAEGPDFKASKFVPSSSDGGATKSAPAKAAAPAAGCITRAGFNVCEEPKPVKAKAPVAKKKAKPQVNSLSTEERASMKKDKAGTCYNRAGFETACQQ
ncbi:MAG: hypothetical protein A6F71_01005 [Cycloclasticus sp. symbiont of Poecilosclerida sp. M]|nr:MAG: hypothetical protein A6F71_01005 [Cycloclasticus sp. symbiont of Poecilosclerida sp. M]